MNQSHQTFGGDAKGFHPLMMQTGASHQPADAKNTQSVQGFGVFESVGGDISLIKPGLELSDQNQLNDVKGLCVKIYRSTNMRYQQIAKLIMRNKAEEIRHQVQMGFCYEMP